jgi:hypothetical protein
MVVTNPFDELNDLLDTDLEQSYGQARKRRNSVPTRLIVRGLRLGLPKTSLKKRIHPNERL